MVSALEEAFVVDDLVRVMVRGLPSHVVVPDLYVNNRDELGLRVWDAREGALRAG